MRQVNVANNANLADRYSHCAPFTSAVYDVINTAGLSKFNIILKVFTPNTASILLFQKETKR
jgi:hypothetical protein